MAETPDGASRLASLETRVGGIESTLHGMADALKGLADKIDQRSATPWSSIWSAVGVGISVLTVIGGLAYWPVTNGLADVKASLLLIQDRADKRIEILASSQVTRAEHLGRWHEYDRQADLIRDRIGRMEARADRRFERLEDRLTSKP